jgi:hypothetical protein
MNTPLCFFLGCCERLLRDDVELIALLRGQGFICGAGEWQFSLSALHGFLSAQLAVGECPEYRVFRQQLLVSDLNTHLRTGLGVWLPEQMPMLGVVQRRVGKLFGV